MWKDLSWRDRSETRWCSTCTVVTAAAAALLIAVDAVCAIWDRNKDGFLRGSSSSSISYGQLGILPPPVMPPCDMASLYWPCFARNVILLAPFWTLAPVVLFIVKVPVGL